MLSDAFRPVVHSRRVEEPEKRGLLEQIWWDAAALSGKEERLC